MLVSLGAVNLSVSKSELEKKEISSAESKKDIMLVPEDITADGIVDIDDLVTVVLQSDNFCQTPGYPNCTSFCSGDLNHDCVTDLTDVIQIYNYITTQNCN